MELTTNQNNILAMYLLASKAELRSGKQWYITANNIAHDIALQFNIDTWKVAGVIAALSPRNKWSRNILDAEALIGAFINGFDCDFVKVCTFNQNKAKAWKILDATSIQEVEEILKGNKVVSFFNNILFPHQHGHVTVDGHAFSIWFGVRHPLDKVPSITDKQYKRIADDYRVVAEHLKVAAHQAQAVTWEVYRNMHGLG